MPRQVTINGKTYTEHDLKCPECGAVMVLKPSRFGLFYGCSNWASAHCNGSHGAHPDGSPLGHPADARTKRARMQAHSAFDKLWKSGGMHRKVAYLGLQRIMNMTSKEAHIGRFTAEECEHLLSVLKTKGIEPDENFPIQSGTIPRRCD